LTREFKRQVVRELDAGKPPPQAARGYQVHPTLILRGCKAHLQYAARVFMGNSRLDTEEAKIAE
jgi:hypothetical protein